MRQYTQKLINSVLKANYQSIFLDYPRHITLSQERNFTLLVLSVKLAIFILANLVSLHYNIYENK